jgi:hypothetical protein
MVVTSQRRAAVALIVSLIAVACGSPPASPATPPATPAAVVPSATPAHTPAGQPVHGIDWAKAPSVARPEDAFGLESPPPEPTAQPSDGEIRSGHPLHFPGQAMMADVAALPGGGLVAVGSVYPGWHPQAWTSADGATWDLADMGDVEFTFPVALAVGGDGRIVAVGRSGSEPLAWVSPDGQSWTAHPVARLGDGSIAERMTTVLATPDGYLAGGSLGPELFERHARFWRSAGGIAWEPVADDAAAFADAEVRSIARLGSGYVAVGVLGSVQGYTGSVAWISPDGRTWTRVDDPALGRGRAVSLVAAPFGGLVAVGSGLNEEEAYAWTSPDGRAWTLAPGEASRQYPGKVRMTDAVVVGDEVIGVGNFVGLQRGTATSWVSRDGVAWRQAVSAPVQQQGEIYAVAAAGPGLVAVGSFGAPDDYIPTVWLSPGR